MFINFFFFTLGFRVKTLHSYQSHAELRMANNLESNRNQDNGLHIYNSNM